MNEYLTTGEAASLLGVTRCRVCVMAASGVLESRKHGRDYQISAKAVKDRLANPTPPGRKKGFRVAKGPACRVCGGHAIGGSNTREARDLRAKLASLGIYPTEPEERALVAYCSGHAVQEVFGAK